MRSRLATILLPIFLLPALLVSGQKPSPRTRAATIAKIMEVYGKLEDFDSILVFNQDWRYTDSFGRYNDRLATLICRDNRTILDTNDVKYLASATDLRIRTSTDRQLWVISWELMNPPPTSPYCSQILLTPQRQAMIISLNGAGDYDSGDNVINDTVIDVKAHNKTYYILVGSSKCGSICQLGIVSMYTLTGGRMTVVQKAFYDGKDYLEGISTTSDEYRDDWYRLAGSYFITTTYRDGKKTTRRYRIL